MLCRKGYTLVELVVVMFIYMILMMISAAAFSKIMTTSSSVSKSAESQIEGIIGLEILRRDLNSTGYGLPWGFQGAITYSEFDPTKCPDSPVKGMCGNSFDDAPSGVPRSIAQGVVPDASGVALNGDGTNKRDAIKGSDYLVIKSATVAFNNSVGKWSYVNYSGSATGNVSYVHKWNSAEDLVSNEAVITLVDTFSGSPVSKRLLAMQSGTSFTYKLGATNAGGMFLPPNDVYKPSGNFLNNGVKVNNQTVNVYALNNFAAGSADTIRMPFNRADYFIRRPYTGMPSSCNPGTGTLYKGVILNSTDSTNGGSLTTYPLIDCVGDMQVVFDMRDATDTTINTHTDTLTAFTAQDIQTRLKSIRVFLLTHEGVKDKNFTYPYTDPNKVIFVGDPKYSSLGRQFTADMMLEFFGSEWRNYRWKVFTVVGQPYNLMY